MAPLSDAQLESIAQEIFVAHDRAKTKLAKPLTSGPTDFKDALKHLETDVDLKDSGIGVIDFTADPLKPHVWLHNGDQPFRIGSASKIAMALAAVQLRLDVRRIQGLGIISTAAEFDELFRNPKLWRKAKAPQSEVQQIATAAGAPLISRIFDFAKSPIDFDGPDPDGRTAAAKKTLVESLPSGHLSWATSPALSFSDRLWLTGSLSDNVAATACVSDIGPAYMKAVLRSYGLADLPKGMHLLAAGWYANIPGATTPPAPPPPRQLANVETIPVLDKFKNFSNGRFEDQRSWVPGSAAALTAYMLALMTDGLDIVNGTALSPLSASGASATIRNNLADGGPQSIASFLAIGVATITTVKKQLNKIGILKLEDGAETPILGEFVYLETEEATAPTAPLTRRAMKYAVVATGLKETTGSSLGAVAKAKKLGKEVHKALLKVKP
jgi:hypothetical protein